MAEAKSNYDPKQAKRARPVGWNPGDGKTKASAIMSNDLTADDGTVLVEQCKTLNIDPATVKPLTLADLPPAYAQGAKEALAALAREWKWSEADTLYSLVIDSRLQQAVNDTLKKVRPVTDTAVDKAISTMRRSLRAAGKTDAEIDTMLAAFATANTPTLRQK